MPSKTSPKDCKVEFHWFSGFTEKFNCNPHSVEMWLQQGLSLDSIVKVVIKDGNGSLLHNVKKKSPFKPGKRK